MTKVSQARRLAGGLLPPPAMRLLGLMVAAASGACLIPQDDTYLAGVPEQRNRPPRIVESQVQPADRIIQDFGAGGLCEVEFSIIVEDPDVDDSISVRWYVDGNPLRQETKLTNNGQALRSDRATLRASLRAANSPLAAPGTHLVEAFVADGFTIDREPAPDRTIKLPDGGVIYDPVYTATYAWFVSTVQGDCQ
ncbi:hypothetical protein P2318_18165 [Myxococcaceae bacterium GXIMD 01537]